MEGKPTIDKDVYLFLVRYSGSKEPIPFGIDEDDGPGEKFSGAKWFHYESLPRLHVKPDIHSIVKKNLMYM